jgi:hypothetical protein
MSKAEERALEKYPLMADDDKDGLEALKYIGMECDCASVFNEAQEAKQAYFIEGYHQAEKDLELGWEDMFRIDEITSQVYKDSDTCQTEVIYQEVLKRFIKERKEK